jgi:hypothetical protein
MASGGAGKWMIGRTDNGQFFYDVVMSDKKIAYLERKWKIKGLRLHRLLGRAILRRDREAEKFWRKRVETAHAKGK